MSDILMTRPDPLVAATELRPYDILRVGHAAYRHLHYATGDKDTMWIGHELALLGYALQLFKLYSRQTNCGILQEHRELLDMAAAGVWKYHPQSIIDMPSWVGLEVIHASHRSWLLQGDKYNRYTDHNWYDPMTPGILKLVDGVWKYMIDDTPICDAIEPTLRLRSDAIQCGWCGFWWNTEDITGVKRECPVCIEMQPDRDVMNELFILGEIEASTELLESIRTTIRLKRLGIL